MDLNEELTAVRVRSAASQSDEERAARRRAAEELAQSDILDGALGVGDVAPAFDLADALGKPVSSDDLLRSGPAVIVFYRGGWCPYCNLELRAWQSQLDQVTSLGAILVAISPELPDPSLTTAERENLAFPVLSDDGNEVARAFGIVHEVPPDALARQRSRGIDLADRQGNPEVALPLPATYVVDPSGVIRYAFVDTDYMVRAEPAEVLDVLRGCQEV